MKPRSIWLLAAGHFFTDVNQGAIAALLPFFIAEHHLSYAAAAGILFAANITSSIIQPLFGYFSDCSGRSWLMPLGVFLAGLGLALAGVMPSYPLILCSVAMSGVGVALFHPDGARLANSASARQKAVGMSYFTVGGNTGFAAGPILATAVLSLWGLRGTLALLIPPALVALILYRRFAGASCPAGPDPQQPPTPAGTAPDQWSPFLRISGAVIVRSILFYGLTTFLPLYWIHILHQSKTLGAGSISILYLSGAVGTLIGGRLAERFGYRAVIGGGFALLFPIFWLFSRTTDLYLATALLIPMGIALYAPFSPMVVLGQRYLPNRVGLASGVTLGLAVSIGGLAAPGLGRLADSYGLHSALSLLLIFPVIATLLALSLPERRPGTSVVRSQ
ncbi:FSR family fosmidomycin resistance protein-like MFS transporter [Hydrogenispora ethanolica]|uniref:FSR family fosmidomycin resistance protein-like MFS transporter n=1 Tax=Hydrogenispora ethanolica TaxID=1082276 RepID=A0A4R1R0J8_HYDET|nr:MFS transporter [Hydrogenispora ethanolica]TCL58799.1 FSR family fosmidomycin resistance protein-like MFS transporter [Hydrogenispora ethanolica]